MLCCHVDNFSQGIFGRSMDSIFGVWLCLVWLLLPFSADFKSPPSAGLSQAAAALRLSDRTQHLLHDRDSWVTKRAARGPTCPWAHGVVVLLGLNYMTSRLDHNWTFGFCHPQMPLTTSWYCRRSERSCWGRLSRSQFMTLSLIPGEHLCLLHVTVAVWPAPIITCSCRIDT